METPSSPKKSPLRQLLILEERVRLSGSALPQSSDYRPHWSGIKIRIAAGDFILRMDDVAEILENRPLTRIPGCASWVLGVVNLRGRLLPVFGLTEYWNEAASLQQRYEAPRIVVLERDAVLVGIVAEEIHRMQKFYPEDFQQPGQEERQELGTRAAFITHSTWHEGARWHQLDIHGLAAELASANPVLSAGPDTPNFSTEGH